MRPWYQHADWRRAPLFEPEQSISETCLLSCCECISNRFTSTMSSSAVLGRSRTPATASAAPAGRRCLRRASTLCWRWSPDPSPGSSCDMIAAAVSWEQGAAVSKARVHVLQPSAAISHHQAQSADGSYAVTGASYSPQQRRAASNANQNAHPPSTVSSMASRIRSRFSSTVFFSTAPLRTRWHMPVVSRGTTQTECDAIVLPMDGKPAPPRRKEHQLHRRNIPCRFGCLHGAHMPQRSG